jgi:hypothetical protein
LVDLAREMSRLEEGEVRRRLEDLDPGQRVTVYRIALALGLPWPVEGRLDGREAPSGPPELVPQRAGSRDLERGTSHRAR